MSAKKRVQQRPTGTAPVVAAPKSGPGGQNLEFLDLLLNLKNFRLLQKLKTPGS